MEEKCKTKVFKGFHHYQCSRKAVRDGFCKQHHPESIKERDRKSEELYQEQKKNSPWYRLQKAIECIKELREALNDIAEDNCGACDTAQRAKVALDRDFNI